MRIPCKYAHEVTYRRWASGEMRDVTVNECWAVKEPFACSDKSRELCCAYKPLYETKLKWEHRCNTDGTWYSVCARCGWHYDLVEANYCPHCGYEYEPWEGTTFK